LASKGLVLLSVPKWSEQDHGNQFAATLQRRKGLGSHSASSSRISNLPGGERRTRIALVEDDRELLETYSAVFENLGWEEVFAVLNGEEIVKAVKDRAVSPDVVIMDYRLPGMNGIEAAKRLLESKPGVKVVITTADDTVRAQARSAGLRFLQKPFSMDELVAYLDVV
jgi:CheY-like chemotaxis protein